MPNEILQIEQVPRTLSGKVLEVPVKRILMGVDPQQAASVDSLADPALARLLRGAGKDAVTVAARRGLVRGALRPAALTDVRGARAVASRYSPIERPTISFMISFAPP